MGGVWRKRLHLVGPPESGQVTSIVRYEPNASFPAHDHPQGEEILVLAGIFSDEYGDWPAGTYRLNPEGFRHAPYSKPACHLFVKLRQFPGSKRQQVAIDVNTMTWVPTDRAGESEKVLHIQKPFLDGTRLLRWDPGCDFGEIQYRGGVEFYVLSGSFEDGYRQYQSGTWLRIPKSEKFRARTSSGYILYCKTSGFVYLNEGTH